MPLLYITSTAAASLRQRNFRQQQQPRGADHSRSEQYPWNSWWIVRFPTSLFREEVEVPPYQSALQRLQLPLDCLTFFTNSQVIQFPWQQFPADTKNQVSPWKFKSVVGSLCVFICVQLHLHFQEETRVFIVRFKLLFSPPSLHCPTFRSWHFSIYSSLHLWSVTAALQHFCTRFF